MFYKVQGAKDFGAIDLGGKRLVGKRLWDKSLRGKCTGGKEPTDTLNTSKYSHFALRGRCDPSYDKCSIWV